MQSFLLLTFSLFINNPSNHQKHENDDHHHTKPLVLITTSRNRSRKKLHFFTGSTSKTSKT